MAQISSFKRGLPSRRRRATSGPTMSAVTVGLVLLLIASACSSDGAESPTQPSDRSTPTRPGSGIDLIAAAGSEPLGLRLSTGKRTAAQPSEPLATVDGEPLSEAQIQAILDRLPEWVEEDSDRADFNRPPQSLRPPLTGETVDVPFPADVDNPPIDVPTGPLEVLRFQPEGEVDIAPYLSITFNQPMVPLTTLGQLDVDDVPVQLTPEVPGRWEWIGTKTLRFEADSAVVDRLPMATDFQVVVPAGTQSETGGELAEATSFTFSTPAVQVNQFTPNDSRSLLLEPLFFAHFDQRVDQAEVLESIRVEADRTEVPIRLATAAEIEADDEVRSRVDRATEGRWIAFRAVEPFAPDTSIVATVGPNTPSAEGPRTSDAESTYRSSTYARLRVQERSCVGGNRCEPGSGLWMQFNNPLDTEVFEPAMVTVTPDIPGLVIAAQGTNLSLQGQTAGDTTYEVTLDASLQDVFGQTLGEDETLEFRVGSARPSLGRFNRTLTTLDPLVDAPSLGVLTMNHNALRIRVFQVAVGDYAAYQSALGPFEDTGQVPDWPVLSDETVDTGADQNVLHEYTIDLSDELGGAPGHLVILVEPTGALADLGRNDDDYWSNRPVMTWAQSTNLGVDGFADAETLQLWATTLTDGQPLADVEITFEKSGATAETNADGLATVDLPAQSRRTGMAIATLGDDTVLLNGDWAENLRFDQALWHVYDDRAVYRPGETVSVKGWVRRITNATDAQLELLPTNTTVTFTAFDAQGNDIATGFADLSTAGGFDFTFELPAGANLGQSWIELALPDGIGSSGHSFQVQEFRRPEFEVTARAESPGPYLVSDPATVAVDATYFSGGPLPNAPVEWNVTTRQATYAPPNWDDYTFGTWVPWWDIGFGRGFDSVGRSGGDFGGDVFFDEPFFPGTDEATFEQFAGITGADGSHFLQMDFVGNGEQQPTTVTAQATVTDVNRQAWASSTNLLVHPADNYVGLRSDKTFVRAGDPLDISAIVTDIDGAVVAGRTVQFEAARLEWRLENGEWQELPAATETCEQTSGEDPVACSFSTDIGGRYQVTGIVTDASGRQNRSELTVWVSGGKPLPNRSVELEAATLIPDAVEYQPGDTAEVLVESPFGAATGLLTLSRNGFVSTETFTVEDGSTVLDIPIVDEYTPNVQVQVDLVGTAARIDDAGEPLVDGPDRPAFASGQLSLAVPPTHRTLTVEAAPADDMTLPGTDTAIDVTVTDAEGEPVAGAELAVVVVDEAVLALSNYQLADPNSSFYAPVGGDVYATYGRNQIELSDPERLREQVRFGGDAAAEDGGGFEITESTDDSFNEVSASLAPAAAGRSATANYEAATPPIDVRTNFDALAVFAPDVLTAADGTATVELSLPDNLTRYRIMVTAADGATRFGSGESNLTARLPLQVRPSAPRFLNFGDRFELPVVVQNQTSEPIEVDVALQTSNLTITAAAGKRVTIPADDRIEVRFDVAAEDVGTARFRVAAISGDLGDAATVALPVYTPSTTEAFATYGVVDNGAIAQPVVAPEGVFPQFGGLEVDTSSTAVQALTDAVLYLHDYRYDSADGYASRLMAVAALRDVLDAFNADGLPAPAELEARVADDIAALVALQNPDGGFAHWERWRPSYPYVSIQAMHALIVAQDAGYTVPPDALAQGMDYLRTIEDRYPTEYGQAIRDSLSAYALNVRLLADDRDAAKAQQLYDRAGDALELDAIAWLWPVLDDAGSDAEILRRLNNAAVDTAGAATFSTNYGDDAYVILHSDRRTDGVILGSLITEVPDADLIPKVVKGLLDNQRRGRWDNVQENAFILLALKQYFDTFESVTPDFVARIWLGDLYAAEHTYQGRTTERGSTLIPMAELIDQGDGDLVVQKDGPGRLYYRLGLLYAPDDLDLDPLDRGFVVERTYEAIDDPDDVRQDADGVWHVKAGAEVKVNLTMVADSRRTHVMLADPLPAGLEPLNPALAVTGEPAPEPDVNGEDEFAGDVGYIDCCWGGSRWWWRWYEHENLRDDRVEAYASFLSGGTYEYSYVARATTPGTFVVPPLKAEEIYSPETFGRSASDTLIVE